MYFKTDLKSLPESLQVQHITGPQTYKLEYMRCGSRISD